MKVAVIGGGGNVAEAISSQLAFRGHSIGFFRFRTHIAIPGTPARSTRPFSRLARSWVVAAPGLDVELPDFPYRWIEREEVADYDVIVISLPSYLAEYTGHYFGTLFAGKIVLNLSDRFLGTYAILNEIVRSHGMKALPALSMAFNGVPTMAMRRGRNGPTVVFHMKPKHAFATYPVKAYATAAQLLHELLGIAPESLRNMPDFLHLAMENVHSIEHAVADLFNLSQGFYSGEAFLYDTIRYTQRITDGVHAIATERDAVAIALLGRRFSSLDLYDRSVFPTEFSDLGTLAGSPLYRIHHERLRYAPDPTHENAFGYEDVGWSMVTLESLARLCRVPTPRLSSLIDSWVNLAGVDYRLGGRTAQSLNLCQRHDGSHIRGASELTWHPDVLDTSPGVANSADKGSETGTGVSPIAHSSQVPDDTALLGSGLIASIETEFMLRVPQFFGHTLAFAFIFGGFAKGYATRRHDVDMFVCTTRMEPAEIEQFRRWYFELHERHGLTPDLADPGELMTIERLQEKIEFICLRPLRLVIESYYEYEALVWGDVLASTKTAIVGDNALLAQFEARCAGLPDRWRQDIMALTPPSEQSAILELPITRVFRRYVRYLKHGPNVQPNDDVARALVPVSQVLMK